MNRSNRGNSTVNGPSTARSIDGSGAGQSSAALEWRDVTVRFGGFAIDSASFSIAHSEWVAIVGPTGAGKTLLLEVVAGFLPPTSGHVLHEGRDITRLPPEERRLGYVPQDDLLFPHLAVRENLLFAVPRRERPGKRAELERITGALGIGHLLERNVMTLSGGEAQRVALGRTLLSGATTLLFDECTSALDTATKIVVGNFLREEQALRGFSVAHVTHDQAEARRLADRIIGIDKGRITGPV